ncbi:hypothetical protein ACFFLM_02345 [Deinococcus oregonensis]|uniref:MalT-like TPR region domain-containing protein n=1 Tax=Deinococcus oregonensis TaxID=1805970 RepID=A0ABV6ATJ1_9DEIO
MGPEAQKLGGLQRSDVGLNAHLSLAEGSSAALRAHSAGTLTRQPLAMASVLIARSYRLLGQVREASHWLENARQVDHHPQLSLHLAVVWDEEAALEEQIGHHFHAHWARTQAAACWARNRSR